MTKTLGDKLAETLAALEAAKIKSLEEQAAADLAKVERDRARRKSLVDVIKDEMVKQIEKGKVPLVKVSNHDQMEWVRAAEQGKAAFQELWRSLVAELGQEKLDLQVIEAHDGMGMESWLNITVVPRPHKIVYRSDGTREPTGAEIEMDPRPVVSARMRPTRTREIRDGLDLS